MKIILTLAMMTEISTISNQILQIRISAATFNFIMRTIFMGGDMKTSQVEAFIIIKAQMILPKRKKRKLNLVILTMILLTSKITTVMLIDIAEMMLMAMTVRYFDVKKVSFELYF